MEPLTRANGIPGESFVPSVPTLSKCNAGNTVRNTNLTASRPAKTPAVRAINTALPLQSSGIVAWLVTSPASAKSSHTPNQ